mmetsp:Transcript_46292/g.54094  ORF Transcript_46292/g.54094 Transcript_46292/m.54094 type:complete len:120 (-) Transcript_46292:344-703(-)
MYYQGRSVFSSYDLMSNSLTKVFRYCIHELVPGKQNANDRVLSAWLGVGSSQIVILAKLFCTSYAVSPSPVSTAYKRLRGSKKSKATSNNAGSIIVPIISKMKNYRFNKSTSKEHYNLP